MAGPDHGYTKIPNSFLRFLSEHPITPQHTMMLMAAIRNCHGFHKPDRDFDLKDLGRWLGWDRRRLSQTAIELVQRGCFCPHGADKKSPKYRIENESRKWKAEWRRGAEKKSVDKPVNKPVLAASFADTLAPLADTLSAPCGHEVELSPAAIEPGAWPNDSIANGFSPAESTKIFDALEFLKKSLKKSLKKEEDPDLKKRNRIFSDLARARLWTDDALLELAKTRTIDELEALHARAMARQA